MKNYIEERVLNVANYIIQSHSTVREAAKEFGYSKSTIHKDMVDRLPKISFIISEQVNEVLGLNKSERHIRGGQATKNKYSKILN